MITMRPMSCTPIIQYAKPVWPTPGWRQLMAAALLLPGSLLLSTSVAAADDPNRGPDVVIIAGEEKVVYEFRQNGELRMVRVVPSWGKPYYLVPADNTKGFGDLERAEMLLPQWVIAEF